jgi:signal transduction histidine kinase
MAVKSRSHFKQIFLFLVAVILPSLVLVAFTLRMISQERELAQKRAMDERRQIAVEIGQHLLVRLEKIKIQEASAAANRTQLEANRDYVNPGVVLVGIVEENRLLLPWETNQKREEFQKLIGSPDFAEKIVRAEKEEFTEKNLLKAVDLYRQSMRGAQMPVQREYARLLLARALMKSNQREEALAHYRRILELPSTVSDEYGIPFSFYAAGCLLDAENDYGEVGERIRTELRMKRWLSPAESYQIKELIENLVKTLLEDSIREPLNNPYKEILEYIHKLEQAIMLQKDFQSLVITPNQSSQEEKNEPIWVAYGDDPWLVSLAPAIMGSKPFLLVVHLQNILTSLKSESGFAESFSRSFHLIPGFSSEGESLGPNFRGIKIAFETNKGTALSEPWSFQRSFYLFGLLLVLSVTLFGAYLLWRDVRREVRMAEMRSQFVSGVSHELKTPLTAIRMFAETLRLGRSKNQKMSEEYLDTIVNESERLTRLLNNVLDFSKIEQGKRIYRPEPTYLSDIIQATARAMEYPLSQQGFTLHVYAEEDLPPVKVDRDAIEQAVLNLLYNAMKYSGESRDIDLQLQRKDGHAVIQVIDRGIGIDPKEQKRIFEKFYRIPSEENKRTTGTGLGLAIASHIVEAHRGHIEVISAPGKGSTFSIYLPLEKER